MVWNDLGRIWEGFGKPTPAEDMFYPTHQPISALFPWKTCFTQLISQFQRYFPALGKHALVVFAHTDNIQFSF